MAKALEQAERTSALAAETMALTRAFPRRVADLRTRCTTLKTKREALLTRAERISTDLHALRTGFTERSWADLTGAEDELAEHLAVSARTLRVAEEAQAAGRWDAFVAAVGTADQELAAAKNVVESVSSRRRELEEVKADPAAEMANARFKVRDAQRLVMRGRDAPPQPWAARLDALSARLDRAEESITRVHPDYWGYLTEVRAVVQATAVVVSEFRRAHS
jgi:chromosome segregation ATPase